MRIQFAVASLVAGLCLPSLSFAQATAAVAATRQVTGLPMAQGRGAGLPGALETKIVAGSVETKIVTGRPYSAETLTETVQVLADGNRITRRAATRVYRDGEGRTRREMLFDDGSPRSISISDPVAHTNYTLDPKTKAAFKAGGTIVAPVVVPGVPAAARGAVQERVLIGRGGRAAAVIPGTALPDDPNVKKEDLGTQNIEGVMATGTRTTRVIPAGEIGNAQEIRVVSEQWFSEELQVLVMTRHSDPRSGDTTYRLRNILRAEPDQNLFTVPPDYTVQQRGIRQPQ